MKLLKTLEYKLRHWHLKQFIYFVVQTYPEGVQPLELAFYCPPKTEMGEVNNCLYELIEEGKIQYNDGIVRIIP